MNETKNSIGSSSSYANKSIEWHSLLNYIINDDDDDEIDIAIRYRAYE